MDRDMAIKWFKEIQGGDGVDRTKFPDEIKGEIAKKFWNDSLFSYGIEYGVLISLIQIYGITGDDLRGIGARAEKGYARLSVHNALYKRRA
ncbi:MAG: hypothetical protein UY48_C0018G0012 [Candidatus Gottesmanbacteria bacterium GW2011_GWB1_49_7]|uniref:Uncharacterized protein n=1 Tax=Candidatus Gottesmanbacteria bacterium GW2011_GWB1_49_7 TaxID=1618448 RepID=A0A0G1VYC4_9BACT|nr:MAG: hypothetical protein UY48_C0018G0012 [Candidatus Gottesmanbacteria bacterium GW2011_GWB1_49_7]